MKKLTVTPISPTTKAWFGDQIQEIALRHDLAGPDIGRVRLLRYTRDLMKELKASALTAIKNGILAVPREQLDALCQRACRELIVIRQIRAAHEAGSLQTEVMRQLPLYAAFHDYLDENPSLLFSELVSAVRDVWDSQREAIGSVPDLESAKATPPDSPAVQEWLHLQIVGLATADDMWGPAFPLALEKEYVLECVQRFLINVQRALGTGDITLRTEQVVPLCHWAAAEAVSIRWLKAARAGGVISQETLTLEALYAVYRHYFEESPEWTQMAKAVAEAAESQPEPPDNRN